MDGLITILLDNKWLLISQVILAGVIALFYAFAGLTMRYSRLKIFIFGGLYSLDSGSQIAWAMSLSRLATVIYCAAHPSLLSIQIGIVSLVLTVILNVLAGDLQGILSQVATYAAIFAIVVLEALFNSYYEEVEALEILRLVIIFFGVFASLYAVYQTVRGHERLVRINGESACKKRMAAATEQEAWQPVSGQ